ncbi:sialate O-acetylesterase [Pedobacter duraquae]|uniref:Sialate O-acetylesterase n=1 Tax=Pedobacter duraquae TaxID=425511 RepID=A0A4R6IM25_9SPHI|nr:sialate O-acetylesterase [Pedobacter duraquae]TDO23121.1 sialate O-acetylesterase [Pedobacter duraquae]
MRIQNGILFILFSLVFSAQAEVRLPALFADKMVLQQKSQVKIWGFSTGKKVISIKSSWDNKTYLIKPSTHGDWQTFLSTPIAGGPYAITISQENKIVLSNILIGEVWICSGQSNMDMPMKGYGGLPITNSLDILMDAPNPNLRLFHVEKAFSATPQQDVKGHWEQADASSASNFSAVGYQFASFLQKHLGIPIGIIQTTWGGSPIEAWIDRTLVEHTLGDRLTSDRAISKANHQTPGNLYNAMVKPLVGYNIAGVIWYQGEQNRHNNQDYLVLQMKMVNLWRNEWNIGAWPFFSVQLAPMDYGKEPALSVPLLREAQIKLTDTLENSGVAVAIDAGELHNIHPANKTIVAKRLAYLALAKTYQKKGIAYTGPKYQAMQINQDTVTVKFSGIPLGMTSYGKKITQFELAGSDHVFHPATARIKDDKVIVVSTEVKNPIAVRYAFKDWCVGELYSVEGLPASPFRTDNW